MADNNDNTVKANINDIVGGSTPRQKGSLQFESIRGKINRRSDLFFGAGSGPRVRTGEDVVALGEDRESVGSRSMTDKQFRERLAQGRSGEGVSITEALGTPKGEARVFGDERSVPFPQALNPGKSPQPQATPPAMTSAIGPGVPQFITSRRVEPTQARRESADVFETLAMQNDAIRAMMEDTGAPTYRKPPHAESMDAGMLERSKTAAKRTQELTTPVRNAEGEDISPKAKAKAKPAPKTPQRGRPKKDTGAAKTPAPRGRPKKK